MKISIEEIERMSPRDLQNSLQEAFYEVTKAEEKCLIASSVCKDLKGMKDIKFAEIYKRSNGNSVREVEMNARISKEWKDYQVALSHAEIEADKAEVERKKATRLWETIRSILSSRTAEMRSMM